MFSSMGYTMTTVMFSSMGYTVTTVMFSSVGYTMTTVMFINGLHNDHSYVHQWATQ